MYFKHVFFLTRNNFSLIDEKKIVQRYKLLEGNENENKENKENQVQKNRKLKNHKVKGFQFEVDLKERDGVFQDFCKKFASNFSMMDA